MHDTLHDLSRTQLLQRIRELERRRQVDAGRRRIVARTLRHAGFTIREIGRLTGVSASQAHKDLRA